ncbi:cupin-like domain-containing protein [Streptomyces sp. NPDC046727]|uniref:cupin-like domain-containing protein n=1 Tax=Streptomyces sp. NPDC046727 TaxID=3155373 RepID=UPI0033D2001A
MDPTAAYCKPPQGSLGQLVKQYRNVPAPPEETSDCAAMTTENFAFTPVDRRRLTPDEFRQEYLVPKKPVVLTGVMDEWPAAKWSIDHLGRRFGDEVVPVRHFEENSRWDAHRMGELRLGDFLGTVMSAPWTRGGRAPLIDSNVFFDRHPELREDVPLWSYFDNWIARLPAEMRARHENLAHGWVLLGPERAVYNLHYDYWSAHACIAHFEGRKRVVLYPPDQREAVYHGRVDVDRPDLAKFPEFAHAQGRMEAILEPGDIAFVPSRWWHQVRYLTPCLSLNSFIVNDVNIEEYLSDLELYRDMAESPEAGVIGELIAHMREFTASGPGVDVS